MEAGLVPLSTAVAGTAPDHRVPRASQTSDEAAAMAVVTKANHAHKSDGAVKNAAALAGSARTVTAHTQVATDGPSTRALTPELSNELAAQTEDLRQLWTDWASEVFVNDEDKNLSSRGSVGSPSSNIKKRARPYTATTIPSGTFLSIGGALLCPSEVVSHIRQIRLSADRYRVQVMLILRKLFENRSNRGIFNSPVNPVALNIPEYFFVIKEPMDLSTIKRKVEQDAYPGGLDEIARDVRLVFSNAMTFNAPATYVHRTAKALLKLFNSEWAALGRANAKAQALKDAHVCSYCHGSPCDLCGEKCLQYQEPVLRCSAPCKARISRGATYYRLGGDRGQHWCNKCYFSLPDCFLGILGQQVDKSSLEQCVNDQVFFEPWVDCTRCKRRLHQTCTLYHPAIADAKELFVCAICVAQEHGLEVPFEKRTISAAATSVKDEQSNLKSRATAITRGGGPWASSLPHTAMGKYLEDRVRNVVKEKLLVSDGPEEAEALVNSLTLRVVSNCEVVTHYAPRIHRWLTAQRRACSRADLRETAFPDNDQLASEFACRSKTVLLFQRIDGVDVMLFVLYVQEYGRDAPPPNQSKVYISYLDSVAYLKPHDVRTSLYQAIMVGYLTWVAARGFEHAYIWACPPQRGDAYIMYCHPKWQRTPGAERLRKWYAGIVDTCKQDNVVLAETNFYEHHLSKYKPLLNTRSARVSTRRGKTKATGVAPVPVAGNKLAVVTGTGAPPGFSNNNNKEIMSPMTNAAMLCIDPNNVFKLKIESSYEQLPYFCGDYLPNETEALLTMLLNPAAGHAACDESVSAWWRIVWGPQTKAELLGNGGSNPNTGNVTAASTTPIRQGRNVIDAGREAAPALVLTPVLTPTWRLAPTSNLDQCDLTVGLLTPQQRDDWLMRRLAAAIKPMSDNFIVLTLNSPGRTSGSTSSGSGSAAASAPQHTFVTTLGTALLASDTSDPDPALPKGIFDTRLELLDMCKHNNFQFDELRRAKLSSLVLLCYHRKALRQALSSDSDKVVGSVKKKTKNN